MGERESSVSLSESNFEDDANESNLESLEYDPDYAAAKEIAKRTIPIDAKFNEGKLTRDEYFEQLELLRDTLMEQNKNHPEDQEIIDLVLNGSLSINSACKRFQSDVENKGENLALVEAKWQIQVATYFYRHRLEPAAAAITELFLERMRDTYKTLNFDDSYAEGVMRGEKGLIATMIALSKKGHEILLPNSEEELDRFTKEDAELKTDLKTVGPDKTHCFWQIKTEARDRTPLVLEINKKFPPDQDNKDFVRDANILFSHAQRFGIENNLTTQAMYIILPEPQIGGKFVPGKPITDSI